jgi:hypothetical protein
MKVVYLCIHKKTGYCHCVFDNNGAAFVWCNKHPDYYYIVRELRNHSSEVK